MVWICGIIFRRWEKDYIVAERIDYMEFAKYYDVSNIVDDM